MLTGIAVCELDAGIIFGVCVVIPRCFHAGYDDANIDYLKLDLNLINREAFAPRGGSFKCAILQLSTVGKIFTEIR